MEGGEVARESLVADGPAVLVFFRFAGCPTCNIALPYYNKTLWPALKAANVRLVAVSPQIPDRLIEIKQRHDLGFTVASDPDNRLGRELGITFEANQATRNASAGKAGWIGETTGTGTWELPQPTVIIVGQDFKVRFVQVNPDWLVRTEAPAILAKLGLSDNARDDA